MRRAIVETLVVLLLGAAAGVVFNAVRSEPLAYQQRADHLLTESGATIVIPAKARRLFEGGEYVFVDARDTREYLDGHIEGALSLPTGQFDELHGELEVWSGGQPLLVYGSEDEAPLADDLARRLKKGGEETVALMPAGFEEWQRRGYPVETGAGGLLDPYADEGAVADFDEARPNDGDASAGAAGETTPAEESEE